MTASVALQISPNPELDTARAAQAALGALPAAAAAPSQGGGAQAALPVSDAEAAITSLLQHSDVDGEFAKSLIALLTCARVPK